MNDKFSWETRFKETFHKSVEKYQSGKNSLGDFFDDSDQTLLNDIGYKPREFFDFVEDYCDVGAPSPESALLIASVRRDFFLVIQKGERSKKQVTPQDLPDRNEELANIPWLPRIITKAKAKLRGELHPDIMYSCQGDMNFLANHNIHPADFLRAVWAADDSNDKIVDYVTNSF